MYVSHLSLHDFRSYEELEVELTAGVTAFIGSNGQGKTNIVEAVDYLSRLTSHRVASDAPLVRQGAEQAVVRAAVVKEGGQAVLEVEINPGRSNRARVNRSPLPRARDLVGLVRTVLFSPEDLALVKGDPAERRRFLDDLMVLRTPRLAGVKADYDRVLKQRNALLKNALADRRRGGEYFDRDPGGLGRAAGPARRGAGRGAGAPGRGAGTAAGAGVRRGRQGRRSQRGHRRLRPVGPAPRGPGRHRPPPRTPRGGGGLLRGTGRSSDRGDAARDDPGRPAPRRAGAGRGHAAGEGLRLAR